jgi:threonine dehydrogenase-like Zn-dependent dehydrogenase
MRKVPTLVDRTVIVIGAGTVGLLAAYIARLSGATVFILERLPVRRQVATQLGLDLIDLADPITDLTVRTGGELANLAIDAAATPSAAAIICALVAPESQVAVLGSYSGAAELDLQAVMFKELTLIGSRTYLPADLDSALILLQRQQASLSSLISGVLPTDAAHRAVRALQSGDGIKFMLEAPE